MNANSGVVTLFYKGTLKRGPPVTYVNGVVKSKVCDGDYLTVDAIRGFIGDLGYPLKWSEEYTLRDLLKTLAS